MSDEDVEYAPPDDNDSSPVRRSLRRRRSEESEGVTGAESAGKRGRMSSSHKRGYTRLPMDLETVQDLKSKIDKRLPQQEYSECVSLRVIRMALTLQEDWIKDKAKRGQVEGGKMKPPRVRETVCRLLGISYSTYSSVLRMYLIDRRDDIRVTEKRE
jgi:hypothetical protein